MSDDYKEENNELERIKFARDHAWDYFEFHGNQRVTLFRFFIGFFTLYLTAVGILIMKFRCYGITFEIFAIIISFGFLGATYLFQQLDLRNRELIKIAEKSMRGVEKEFERICSDPNNMSIKDQKIFENEKNEESSFLRHTLAFRMFFLTSYLLSILCLMWSSWSLCAGVDNCTITNVRVMQVPDFGEETVSASQKSGGMNALKCKVNQ